MKVVFVGQGPNQKAWEHGLALGRSIVASRDPASGRTKTAEEIAEDYCRKIAITGAIGSKLGEMLGMPLSTFFRSCHRVNLNARWNGKAGKGDKFDRAEGNANAGLLIEPPSGGPPEFTHFVLLGQEVARCFGFQGGFLEVRERNTPHLFFLLFPHPSGLSTWWNEDFNRFRARKRLREFVGLTNP